MPQHKETLIKLSIEKAEEALRSAESNIHNNHFLAAQNRAYYSVFYIVLALSYLDEFVTGKHSRLMGWFNKKYVYEDKVFDKSFSKIYSKLIANREKFDYDVTKFPEKEKTIQDLEEAKYFVNTVKSYIYKELEKLKD